MILNYQILEIRYSGSGARPQALDCRGNRAGLGEV